MINFLHNFTPEPVLISLGPLDIYWYGLFIVLGIIACILVTFKVASFYGIRKETIIDNTFYLIIAGIIGARLYHILLELPYYLEHPANMIKIWNGGLAIHGAFIAGALTMFYLARHQQINFWLMASLFAPGLALGQAIGRWGNYFNQELYGLPTQLPWSIPIEPGRRMAEYYNHSHFHPTFLYESIGNLAIAALLFWLHYRLAQGKKIAVSSVVLAYLVLYSILRFSLEFIRIDATPVMLNLRWPQIVSILLIFASFLLFIQLRRFRKKT